MISTTIHKGDNCNFVNNAARPVRNKVSGEKRHQTMFFNNPVHIIARSAIVGDKEAKGPIGKYFKYVKEDIKMGEKSFERAEIRMLDEAIRQAMLDAKKTVREVDLLLTGDLLNQMTTSSYVARNLNMPHLGLYSACSTMTEALGMGASMVNAGYFNTVACAVSSHFATAERQFRFPLEYGSQRPPYAQWTVTAAGCTILSSVGDGPTIKCATMGRVIDFGQNDLSNMGAAMAPAAMDTMCALFEETNTTPADYDLIITGDLGKLGSDIMRDIMREQGYELGQNYTDCGTLIYDVNQHCYQGGSGCGCSASVMNAYILQKMEEGEYNRIAYFATGALMSTQSCCQGETIPCVSHGVVIER